MSCLCFFFLVPGEGVGTVVDNGDTRRGMDIDTEGSCAGFGSRCVRVVWLVWFVWILVQLLLLLLLVRPLLLLVVLDENRPRHGHHRTTELRAGQHLVRTGGKFHPPSRCRHGIGIDIGGSGTQIIIVAVSVIVVVAVVVVVAA